MKKNLILCIAALICMTFLASAMGASGLADTPWPKFQANVNNTGQSPYNGPQTNNTIWSELPASSQANLTWFDWTEKSIKLRAGEEVSIPVKVDVPAETATGSKLFREHVKSVTTGISGFNTGYLTTT